MSDEQPTIGVPKITGKATGESSGRNVTFVEAGTVSDWKLGRSEKQVATYRPKYELGSTVTINNDDVAPTKAIVTAFMVEHGGTISYRVSWFDDKTRHTQWVTSCEISRESEEG